ncbi:hypothetical protein PSECIP111951_01981 [Pseudoalteromonas holothuriae]|uniref:Uncharacterized protein n=1 Tax=Pseudoalteromonas holothuriae TaxID=2963714 RepID=A0A9W4VTJ6_9GAMM|nr:MULTISPECIES: hypothetical protein [unclassified Pseudoalteromonas]CAH9054387.1 hypothetical protein PSECIP111854_01364 [Pseudoalteromonas sp. CIP111854]CAH9058981.1 hypothetical protein PSECIP111951_01981 [Pseudoalteromonas sp. CIP111951]
MKLLKSMKVSKKRTSTYAETSHSLDLSAKVLSNKELLSQISGARGGGAYPPKSTRF